MLPLDLCDQLVCNGYKDSFNAECLADALPIGTEIKIRKKYADENIRLYKVCLEDGYVIPNENLTIALAQAYLYLRRKG